MDESRTISDVILSEVKTMMDKVMNKVLITDPFVVEKHHAAKPMYAALVPDEIFKGSHFERRFVTPFGSIWEKLTVAAATVFHGRCEKGYTIRGTIGDVSLKRIQETLNRLEHPNAKQGRIRPDWTREIGQGNWNISRPEAEIRYP